MQGVSWKPEWLPLLRQKRAQGLSCGQIAKQMSEELHVVFTRNSIIGKCARERIPAPGKLATQQNHMAQQHRLTRKSKEVAMTTLPVLSPPPPSAATPEPAASPTPTPAGPPYQLLDLPDNACRWPVNNRASILENHLFCGQQVARASPPYCAEHYEQGVVHARIRDLIPPSG